MKLGLIIKNTSGGEQVSHSFNTKDDWTRFASDARSAIKELANFDGTGKVVYLVKFLGSLGYLLCIIKARSQNSSGRPNDNTAVWIYVPSKVKMSAEEMENVLKGVKEVISNEYRTDESKLSKIFDKSYDEEDLLFSIANTYKSKDDGAYAMKYYNDGNLSLQDLLGKNIAQPEYKNYVGVFFVEKESGITFKDESNKVLQNSIIDIVHFQPLPDKDGFKAYIKKPNGEFVKFDKNIEVASEETVSIEWRKKGNAPIVKNGSIDVNINNKPDKFSFQSNEIKRRIERSKISVKDEKGNDVPNAKITISCNDPKSKKDLIDFLDFEEAKLNNLCIEASAEGYECYDGRNKVNKYSDAGITLVLTRKRFRYKVNTNNEEISEAELSFFSTNGHPEKSPLEGYELKNETLKPIGDDKKTSKSEDSLKIKFFALGFASCFALILLLFGGWHFFKEDTSKRGVKEVTVKESDNKDSSRTAQDTAAKATSTQEELKKKNMESYLSQSMEKDTCKKLGYEELWNALNTFDVDKVETYAKEFSELQNPVKKLKKCKEAKVLEKLPGKKYTEASGKMEIKLSEYEKFLEKKLQHIEGDEHSSTNTDKNDDQNNKNEGLNPENEEDRPSNS